MKATFWGVRGSIPTPETDHLRWGGNTSCIEVQANGHAPVVLDSGTGIRRLGHRLAQQGVSDIELVFSHCHIDHILGLPFFAPLHDPNARVRITLPGDSVEHASQTLSRYLDGVLSPLLIGDLACDLRIESMVAGKPVKRNGIEVTGCELNHPGGSLAYRLNADGASFAYVTDTAPLSPYGTGVAAGQAPSASEAALIEALRGCDAVLFDTMFSEAEFLQHPDWGHSYPEYAVAVCEAAQVDTLWLFHHLPSANDDRLDALENHWAGYAGPLRVRVAREGHTLELGVRS